MYACMYVYIHVTSKVLVRLCRCLISYTPDLLNPKFATVVYLFRPLP